MGVTAYFLAFMALHPSTLRQRSFPDNHGWTGGLLPPLKEVPSDRKIQYSQGKILGGSSALNAMAYHRGNVGSYSRWAHLVEGGSYTFPN